MVLSIYKNIENPIEKFNQNRENFFFLTDENFIGKLKISQAESDIINKL